MSQVIRFGLSCILLCVAFFAVDVTMAAGKSKTGNDEVSKKVSDAGATDVMGNWQVSWTNRGGTQQCILRLQQDGEKLIGTFQDGHGISPLSGIVDGKQISFDVQFAGPRPFTIRFSGIADAGNMDGTSKAIGVDGAGAFLGHGGEIVHPEHPWTAKRLANQSTGSGGISSNPSTPTKN